MKVVRLLLVMLLTCDICSAQVSVIDGTLTDRDTGAPVPFASVGIVGYAVGTSSNADGSFTLKIPDALVFKKLTIKITCVGYENFLTDNPTAHLAIKLKPSKTVLEEIVISASTLHAEDIVRKALKHVRKNYNTKPFVYNTFYRHYCKDDDQYGRLIEAAVDIYKRKGYRTFQAAPGAKDEVRVTQLRRTFDNTKITINHAPIALYNIMAADELAIQTKMKSSDPNWIAAMGYLELSGLRNHLDLFEFDLDQVTSYDNEEVYKISYRLKADSIKFGSGLAYPVSFAGALYINTRNLAFIKTESQRRRANDTLRTSSSYKLNGKKYYLYHSMREGSGIHPQLNVKHAYHIELMVTDILTRKYSAFKGKEPGKEVLLNIPYDSTFWDDYNIIKATPLEEKIVADLERSASLKNQFSDYVELERERFFSGKEDEERFNQLMSLNKGRVLYLSFWKSDCGACLRELEYERKLMEKYKYRVGFIYLSLDDDLAPWKEALKKHKLTSPYASHFRIGSQADAVSLFKVNEMPRYVLVDKKGFFADQNARRPTDPDLEKDIERLLAEKIDKP